MNKPGIILLALLVPLCASFSQQHDITDSLFDTYETYRESRIKERRIKHSDIQPLIREIASQPEFTVSRVGTSIEGRSLQLISIGSGETDVFLWSQMHGDEPTATQAIFDILNFLKSKEFRQLKKQLLDNVRLHFLPMLNPDGAEVYQRRNTLGIDINRDALRLQSPEGRTLKRVRDSLEAEFGFNLHDQSTYYNAERTEKPATISYLAPAFNYEKDISPGRADAMKVIVFMNRVIQQYAPGQVGRYNDDFEPRAFGDNIQKWGTRTILIESGGYPEDTEKQFIRKLNYVSILSAIHAIASGGFEGMPLEDYEKIPENDRKLFDLKITGVTYPLLGEDYLLDLGIHRQEIDKDAHTDFWIRSSIADQGDLSTFYGYQTLDAEGYRVKAAGIYPKTLGGMEELGKLDAFGLLRSGYAYVRMAQLPQGRESSPVPVHLIRADYKVPSFRLFVGANPTFLLEKSGELHYAVVNGFLIDLRTTAGDFRNAMIYR